MFRELSSYHLERLTAESELQGNVPNEYLVLEVHSLIHFVIIKEYLLPTLKYLNVKHADTHHQ